MPASIDANRYRKVRRFFLRLILHLLFWDIVLNRPVLRLLRTSPVHRWQRLSRNFRELAIDMGGVLIKLGQFLSVRVDILPVEVTAELSGLHDEIPAEPLDAVLQQIEEDFGRPPEELFSWFAPQPIGSASLGQVHVARLAASDAEVVVKVLRPGIEVLVETDLAAIGMALKWLGRSRRISRRVDLAWLFDEFAAVTRNELDCAAEGKNAERFARDFAGDPHVLIPRIYWEYSALRTLTLENVAYIKIGDLEAMRAAGIATDQVAGKLYTVFLHQAFVSHFMHADPHPGNIFIRPLPVDSERTAGRTCFTPGEQAPYQENRPFQIVFVDFGMVVTIPPRLRTAIREYVIGVGTRDAQRMVQSYVKAGTLLPGADLQRLEAAHEALFERFWGANIGEMRELVFSEADTFLRDYRDVIYAAPFQFQVDMLFVVRSIALLSGLATKLDETFDPWAEIIPFAEQLAAEQLPGGWRDWFGDLAMLAQLLYRLPAKLDDVATRVQQGNLVVNHSFTADSRTLLLRIEQAVNRLSWTLLTSVLLAGGVYAQVNAPHSRTGAVLLGCSALCFLLGIWRSRR